MTRYLDEVFRPLVLILPKTNGHIKTFNNKSGYKNKSNKLMSLHVTKDKLLEKDKSIWTKIEDLKKLNWMIYQSIMIDM